MGLSEAAASHIGRGIAAMSPSVRRRRNFFDSCGQRLSRAGGALCLLFHTRRLIGAWQRSRHGLRFSVHKLRTAPAVRVRAGSKPATRNLAIEIPPRRNRCAKAFRSLCQSRVPLGGLMSQIRNREFPHTKQKRVRIGAKKNRNPLPINHLELVPPSWHGLCVRVHPQPK